MDLIILGSTGSIGTQTLDIVNKNRDRLAVKALSCGTNIELLREQIDQFKPEIVSVASEADALELAKDYPQVDVVYGREGLCQVAGYKGDMVVNGLVGINGLEPTLAAIDGGNNIALANKETLVAGGQLVMEKARDKGVKILPLDSEHSAIFQCLQGEDLKSVRRILLTASGGPFRNYAAEALAHVKVEDALKHPKWKMGKKITVDSATLVNKGLEVIEAKWLFNINLEQITVVIHPQSIVHSMVEFDDGAIIAQLGAPDMRVPISYALNYPNRGHNDFGKLDMFKEGGNLTFEKPDTDKFRGLALAFEAGEKGGSYPVAFNGANESLVGLFLEKKIKFTDITKGLETVMNKHKGRFDLTLEDILYEDQEARRLVSQLYGGK